MSFKHFTTVLVFLTGTFSNRTARRLRTAEWRKNVARDCAFPVLRDIFSSFCRPQSSSRPVAEGPQRREMSCFADVWTTWARDNKFSTFSSNLETALTNFIPGSLALSSQATRFGTESTNDWTKKEFLGEVLAVVVEKKIQIKTFVLRLTSGLNLFDVLRAPAI